MREMSILVPILLILMDLVADTDELLILMGAWEISEICNIMQIVNLIQPYPEFGMKNIMLWLTLRNCGTKKNR